MLMSEFVTKVLSEIRSFSQSHARVHPLESRESEAQYHLLIKYLLEHKNCHDNVIDHTEKMKKILSDRFYEKVFTRVFFHITPYSKINYAYAVFARQIAEIVKMPVYNLLMPRVKFTKDIYALKPYEFVLIKRGDVFIPINIVDYLDHLTSVSSYSGLQLTKKEAGFIIHHSDETRHYAHALLMQDEEAIASSRKKLTEAMQQGNYRVTANFDPESDAHLAKSLLPTITNGQELATIIANYIPKLDWQFCLNLINNKNLFKAMLAIEFDRINLKSTDMEGYLGRLIQDLNERCQLLETLLAYLALKEVRLKAEIKKIPNLMRLISTFDMASMLQKVNWQMRDYKRLLGEELKRHLILLPKDCLKNELGLYSSPEELVNAIISFDAAQKQIHTFNLLSMSDLFLLMLNFDIEKYKNSLLDNVTKLSKEELLLTGFNDELVKYLLKKDSVNCANDNFIRAYFFLLAEVYKRQRDFKGDQLIALANKNSKMTACELFQHFLLSDYPLNEFNVYPLDDALLMQADLPTLYDSLTSKTLGGLSRCAFEFFSLFCRYKNQAENELTFREDNRHIAGSYVGEIEGWQDKVNALAKFMPKNAWRRFVDDVYHLNNRDEARQYVAKMVLNYARDLDTVVDILLSYFCKTEWQGVVKSVGLINWLCAITGMDITPIKVKAGANPLQFETEFWKCFDRHFDCLLENSAKDFSPEYRRAYFFCIAISYQRQREKRGDYTSGMARTASLFRINVPSKNDKMLVSQTLIDFILEDNVEWSESGLKNYLQKKYKGDAKKYESILLSDTLGVLTHKMLACNLFNTNLADRVSNSAELEEYKNYKNSRT